MADQGRDAFFIGYTNALAPGLARFLAMTGFALVAIMAILGFLLSRRTADPGFAFAGIQHVEISGILEARPYPVLRVQEAPGTKARTLLLAGEGKYGVAAQAQGLDRRAVTVGGYIIKRGTLEMLLVDDRKGIVAASTNQASAASEPVSLGRWRLSGEICDGKCYAGAMSPGNGLAHKACANLCLIGGVPPVFVSGASVGGSEFFLLTDNRNDIDAGRFLDAVGRLVSLEGEVLRIDNFFIFKSDPTTLRPAGP